MFQFCAVQVLLAAAAAVNDLYILMASRKYVISTPSSCLNATNYAFSESTKKYLQPPRPMSRSVDGTGYTAMVPKSTMPKKVFTPDLTCKSLNPKSQAEGNRGRYFLES